MPLQPLQLTASSAPVLACPDPVSQITPKAESNRRQWTRISDCSQRDAEAGLRKLAYHALLVAVFERLVLESPITVLDKHHIVPTTMKGFRIYIQPLGLTWICV